MKYLNIFWTFLVLGCTSFGGPIAHLMYFRRAFVVDRKWLSEAQYSNLVALCQTLPGPASSQVGFSIGLIRAGLLGGILAFVAFTLPSVLVLIVFANYLSVFTSVLGHAILQGLAILAFAVVLNGVVGMGKNLCSLSATFTIALAAFIATLLFTNAATLILVIFAGGFIGYVWLKPEQTLVVSLSNHEQAIVPKFVSIIALLIFATLFIVLPLLWPVTSDFYRSGALVFGGGHVVLPLLEQAMVNMGSISETDFLAGYGATQAVPGPLFSFAGYLGYLLPENGGINGALVGTIFIFLPGFLLVLAILPFWHKISRDTKQGKIIAGANAAVVGILAAALYDPIFIHAINGAEDVAIAAIAYAALSRFNVPVIIVVLGCITAKMCLVLLA